MKEYDAMSVDQSYEYQKNLLDGLERNLHELKLYMKTIEQKYQSQLNVMDSAGFLKNYTEPLKERHALFQTKITNLQDLIDQHKSVIDRHQSKLNQLIQSARD